MTSGSTLAIEWVKPDLAEEQWEFFHHPDKQDFYLRHGVVWESLVTSFDTGTLERYPRTGRIGEAVVGNSYHRYEDYARYLAKAKRGYRKSYAAMEEALQHSGRLTLKSPIILRCRNEALLFSGYRRLCLAWNYGMVPYVWVVDVP